MEIENENEVPFDREGFLERVKVVTKFKRFCAFSNIIMALVFFLILLLPLSTACGVSIGTPLYVLTNGFLSESGKTQYLPFHALLGLVLIILTVFTLIKGIMQLMQSGVINEVDVKIYENTFLPVRYSKSLMSLFLSCPIYAIVCYVLLLRKYEFVELGLILFVLTFIACNITRIILVKYLFKDNFEKYKELPKKIEENPETVDKISDGMKKEEKKMKIKLWIALILCVAFLFISLLRTNFFNWDFLEVRNYGEFLNNTYATADGIEMGEKFTYYNLKESINLNDITTKNFKWYSNNYMYYAELKKELQAQITELNNKIRYESNSEEELEELKEQKETLAKKLEKCSKKMSELTYDCIEVYTKKKVTYGGSYGYGSYWETVALAPTYYMFNNNVTSDTENDKKEVEGIELSTSSIRQGQELLEKITAHITYKDGSIRIIYVPVSAFENAISQKGEQTISWSDTYGEYSATIEVK